MVGLFPPPSPRASQSGQIELGTREEERTWYGSSFNIVIFLKDILVMTEVNRIMHSPIRRVILLYYRVPECLSLPPNWVPPPPLPQASASPPWNQKGGGGQHSLAGEGAGGDLRECLELCILCDPISVRCDFIAVGLQETQSVSIICHTLCNNFCK